MAGNIGNTRIDGNELQSKRAACSTAVLQQDSLCPKGQAEVQQLKTHSLLKQEYAGSWKRSLQHYFTLVNSCAHPQETRQIIGQRTG